MRSPRDSMTSTGGFDHPLRLYLDGAPRSTEQRVRSQGEKPMMPRRRSRGALRSISSCLVMIFGIGAAIGAPSIAAPVNIGPEPLAQALTEFARQSDRQILYSTGAVADKRTEGVRGDYEPEAALRLLLKDTGLGFRVTPDNAI